MRVAAIYDVHGNLPALGAVLDVVERLAVDAIVFGGDVCSGPYPRETLAVVRALECPAFYVRGNTDRKLVAYYDDRETGVESGDVWDRRDRWAASLLTRDERDFLAKFVATVRLEVAGIGTTVFCHGSPRSDKEPIDADTPEEALGEMLANTPEETVVCGHTHAQFDRLCGRTRVVNAGSVGLPRERSPGAYWALFGDDVSLRHTPYDVPTVAQAIRREGWPGAEETAAWLLAPPT